MNYIDLHRFPQGGKVEVGRRHVLFSVFLETWLMDLWCAFHIVIICFFLSFCSFFIEITIFALFKRPARLRAMITERFQTIATAIRASGLIIASIIC